MDEVREGLLSVNGHDGDPFAVAALQLGVSRDVDLLELEWNLRPDLRQHALGALAEVTPLRAIELHVPH